MSEQKKTQTTEADEANLVRTRADPAPLTAPSAAPSTGESDIKKPTGAAPAAQPEGAAEFAASTNTYVTEYIKFGDAKAGSILSFATVVAGAAASSAPSSLKLLQASSMLAVAAGGLALLGILVSALAVAWASIQALAPRTPKASSLHSFPDIAKMTPEEYEGRIRALDRQSVAREYARHTHTLSAVALQKYDSIGSATRALRWMIAFGAIYAAIAGEITLLADDNEKPKTVIVVPGNR